MELIDSLIYFKRVFGRQGRDLGSFQIGTESSNNLDTLEQMYNILLFTKTLTVGGEFFINLYPQSMLPKIQQGWYIILSKENQWISDNIHWNKNWIVFATRNDDAIFYNQIDGGVYGSIEKKKIYKLSNTLSIFFYVLSQCMEMEDNVFNFNTSSDDEEPIKAFLERTREILSLNMELKNIDEFMNFFFA